MDERTRLFEAIERGERPAVERLLDEHPDLANARAGDDTTALLAAAYRGRHDVLDLLLARGAQVNLHEAATLGLTDQVAEALDRDPGLVNSHSHDGWTPLHLAAYFGRQEAAELLLARGADINARSRNERIGRENTPLHAAAANRQTSVAKLLIDRGADVNAKDGHGFTPLGLAAGTKNDLLVIILLEKGARSA